MPQGFHASCLRANLQILDGTNQCRISARFKFINKPSIVLYRAPSMIGSGHGRVCSEPGSISLSVSVSKMDDIDGNMRSVTVRMACQPRQLGS